MSQPLHRFAFLLPLALAGAVAPAAAAQQQIPGRARPEAPRVRMPVKEVQAGDDVRWLANWSLKDVAAAGDAEPFRFDRFFVAPDDAQKPGDEAEEGADQAGHASQAGPPELLLISFWSHTCPWQNAWDPELDAIAQEYRERGVRVIGIDSNVGEVANPGEIRAYRKRSGIGFPVLLDPRNQLADRFGARTTPHLYLVDERGRVLYTGAVDDDAHKKKKAEDRHPWLRDALDAALAGEEIAVASSPPKGCSIKRVQRKKSDKLPARG